MQKYDFFYVKGRWQPYHPRTVFCRLLKKMLVLQLKQDKEKYKTIVIIEIFCVNPIYV